MDSELIRNQLKEQKELDGLRCSPGGKFLIKQLNEKLRLRLDKLLKDFHSLDELEIKTNLAAIKLNLDMIRLIRDARDQKSLLQKELDDILEE